MPCLHGETRARPDLALEALGDFQNQPGRHQGALARQDEQRPVLGNRGAQIHAGRARGLVGRKRQAFAVRQPDDADAGR